MFHVKHEPERRTYSTDALADIEPRTLKAAKKDPRLGQNRQTKSRSWRKTYTTQ